MSCLLSAIDLVCSVSNYCYNRTDKFSPLVRLTGVLEVGLFCGLAEAAFFGQEDGTVFVRYADGVRESYRLVQYATIANLGLNYFTADGKD